MEELEKYIFSEFGKYTSFHFVPLFVEI